MAGVLILEDGTCFPGRVFGYRGGSRGEVVFNTGMVGYQEVLTDPSYAGQIVVMTYPLIGNYGINSAANQADKSFVRGFIVRENSSFYNNWQAEGSLEDFLSRNKIVGLTGVDTRALTRHLRSRGTMKGIISISSGVSREHFSKARNLVEEVTCSEIREYPGGETKLGVLDFGIKRSIVNGLLDKGFSLMVFPADTPAEEILAHDVKGLFLSNGPGDPKDVPYAVETVQKLLGRIPVCGICLGHQIISLATGADTYKLKFGHRGVNHPVKDLKRNRVYITSQNHGYAVDEKTVSDDMEVTHLNLNDGTVEGIRHKTLPVYSVQYHPEASPGPDDSYYIFEEFRQLVENSSL